MADKFIAYSGPIVTRREAMQIGLTRYFTGRPCLRGHVSQQLTNNGRCRECDRIRTAFRYANSPEYREQNKAKIRSYRADPDYVKTERSANLARRVENPIRTMLYSAKARAAVTGRTFSITELDIIRIPDRCPILGIPLIPGSNDCDRRPSIDRINNELGYIPGNIAIISFRANRLKADGTIDEFIKLISWLNNHQDSPPLVEEIPVL